MEKPTLDLSMDPWLVREEDYPAAAPIAHRLRFLINYAVLAPSSHNTQPWRFVLEGDAVRVQPDWVRALPVVDPHHRELVMSCGAALFHLRVAMAHFGFDAKITRLPEPSNPGLLAVARCRGGLHAEFDESLFIAMRTRRTNRSAFESRQVSASARSKLDRVVSSEGAALWTSDQSDAKAHLASLIARGDFIQQQDPGFRDELAGWIRRSHRRHHDGIPLYALGMEEVPEIATALVASLVRTFDMGDKRAAEDRELATGSPLLAIISTDRDAPRDWLAAGEALSHLLLQAEADGLSVSFLNQAIEVPALRTEVADFLGGTRIPQLLLRIGHADQAKPLEPTPRRPVSDVLDE